MRENKSGTPNMSLNNSMVVDEEEEAKSEHHVKRLFEGIECEDSLYLFSKKNFVRISLYKLVTHHDFDHFILGFIVVSSLKLAVDTYIPDGTETANVSN
jgi:hypothetical protein